MIQPNAPLHCVKRCMNAPLHMVQGCTTTSKDERVRPIHNLSTVDPSDVTVTFDESYDSAIVYDDVEDPKLRKVPAAPSQQEIEDHNVNHLPFRSWCKHCVRGKSKAHPHRVTDNRISGVPIVSIDYMFMSENQKATEEKGMPNLVLKDRDTKTIKACTVTSKGINDYAVRRIVKAIEELGHKKIILKSDGESAIVALKRRIKHILPLNVVLEESPVGDHQANGEIEMANQLVQGQFRVMKCGFESRIGTKLVGTHPLVPWLLIHAADTLNRYVKGEDGRTAYQRVKGRAFRTPVTEWGECVLYCRLASAGENKFDYRWDEGVWLGVKDNSGEAIIGTSKGVVKARDWKHQATHQERWNTDVILGVKGTPWEPVPGSNRLELLPQIAVPNDAIDIIPAPTEPVPVTVRRMPIFKRDVMRIGLTPGCNGCMAAMADSNYARDHSAECRKRHEKDAQARNDAKLERANMRLNRAIVKMSKGVVMSDNTVMGDENSSAVERDSKRVRFSQDDDVVVTDAKPLQNEAGSGNRTSVKRRADEDRDDMELADSFEVGVKAAEDTEKDASMDALFRASGVGDMFNQHCKFINAVVTTNSVNIKVYDTNTGRELSPTLVDKARNEEIKYVHAHKVYDKVPLAMSYQETGKEPIPTGWVNVNKGDDDNPEIRCRIVGKEFNTEKRLDLFAATPPLEAKKLLFSLAVTEGIGFKNGNRSHGMKLMFIDITRAYYYAKARRRIFIQLPDGDREPGMCGLLNMSLVMRRKTGSLNILGSFPALDLLRAKHHLAYFTIRSVTSALPYMVMISRYLG